MWTSETAKFNRKRYTCLGKTLAMTAFVVDTIFEDLMNSKLPDQEFSFDRLGIKYNKWELPLKGVPVVLWS